MYELTVNMDFAAAHMLRGYKGKCENLHGHNWKVQVQVKARSLDRQGMVMDFKDVKDVAAELLEKFDHRCLNELPEFSKTNPTTENVARILYRQLSNKLRKGAKVSKVTAWESDGCGASYWE